MVRPDLQPILHVDSALEADTQTPSTRDFHHMTNLKNKRKFLYFLAPSRSSRSHNMCLFSSNLEIKKCV